MIERHRSKELQNYGRERKRENIREMEPVKVNMMNQVRRRKSKEKRHFKTVIKHRN